MEALFELVDAWWKLGGSLMEAGWKLSAILLAAWVEN